MNSALQLLNRFKASTAEGFPLGEEGAEILDQLERMPDVGITGASSGTGFAACFTAGDFTAVSLTPRALDS